MKKLLSIITALLVAALFTLPVSAIAHLDGSEPDWDGDPGIRPASATIDGFEPIEPISEDLQDGNAVLYIGEPTDTLPGEEDAEDIQPEFDRSHLARGADAGAEAELASSSNSLNLALYIGLAVVSLTALALSIVAVVKASKKK